MRKPAVIVKEYVYCPRIAYYKLFSIYEPPTESMGYAKSSTPRAEQLIEAVRQRLGDGYEVLSEVFVESKRIGVVGRVDAVAIGEREAVPIEVKLSTSPEKLKRIALHHLAQCLAYCIAVEETFRKPVNRFLLISLEPRAVYEVRVGANLREFIYRISRELDRMIDGERIPPPTASRRRCTTCFYRKMCTR